MPSASRNANRKRRIRRNITLLRRAGQAEALAKTQAIVHILILLAQKGGEVTVTKGTIEQVMADFSNLAYKLDKTDIEGEFIFRLVTKTEAATDDASGS